MQSTAIARAVELAGGQTELARKVGSRQQQVWNWISGRPVPDSRCPHVERSTGVPCEELRPDLPWVRIPDPDWPWHPQGRPCIDVTRVAANQAAEVQHAAAN